MARARKAASNINVTPLVDVLLILLVILMLVAPFAVKRLPVELPRTDFNGAPVLIKATQVSVTPEGGVYLDGVPVTLEDIRQRIQPDTSIELYVDKGTTYETLAKVANGIQAAGPKEIVLVSR